MLKLFQSSPQTAESAARPAARPPVHGNPGSGQPAAPLPLHEVSEDRQESDGALREDWVAFQDSQMPSAFHELGAVKTRDDPPKGQGTGPDAFSTVRKPGF